MKQLLFNFFKEESVEMGATCQNCMTCSNGICMSHKDKVLDNDTCEEFIKVPNRFEDKEMDELFKSNTIRYHQIMEHYRVPMITRDEIKILCRWS